MHIGYRGVAPPPGGDRLHNHLHVYLCLLHVWVISHVGARWSRAGNMAGNRRAAKERAERAGVLHDHVEVSVK